MSGEHIRLSNTLKLAEQFNGLQARLSGPSTDIHRLTGILLFLVDDLAHLATEAGARPYLEELIGLLPENADRLPLDGLSPELLEEGARALERFVAASHVDENERAVLGVWVYRLSAWAVFQFVRVGASERAAALLGAPEAERGTSPRKGLDWEAWTQRMQIHQPDWTAAFSTCVAFHTQVHPAEGSSCVVPVAVISPHSTSRRTQVAGYCRAIRLVVTGLTRKRDVIALHVRHGDSTDALLEKPIRAARGLLAETAPSLLRHSCIGSISMSDGQAAHAGNSAGLAIGLLYFCEMNRFCGQRRRYSIEPSCMITGEVHEDGTVAAVDPDSLEPKVLAAFFSSTELLVVPECHTQLVRRHINRLRTTWPARDLQVRGVGTVQEALADRRIVRSRQVPRIVHAARRFWNSKWLVVAAVAGLVFGGAGMWWSENRIDPHVSHWTYDNTAYIGLNEDGQEALRLPMTQVTRDNMAFVDQTLTPWAAVADVDGDGFGDLVAFEYPDVARGVPGQLVTMNGRTRDITTCLCFDIPLPYPEDLTILSGGMYPKSLLVEDLDRDGNAEVYVTALHSFYPAVLLKIDPLSGQRLATYHHPGAFYTLRSDDVDNDGYEELLLGGTNNSMDRAILAILDPRRVDGMGPGEGEYQPGTGPTLNEDAYIRLPLTELGVLLPNTFPHVTTIRRMSADSLIFMASVDTMAPRPDSTYQQGGLYFWVDYDLQPVAVGSTDQFDTVWTYAHKVGLQPQPINNALKIDIMSRFERLTPNGWQNIPISPRSKAWNLMPGQAVRMTQTR